MAVNAGQNEYQRTSTGSHRDKRRSVRPATSVPFIDCVSVLFARRFLRYPRVQIENPFHLCPKSPAKDRDALTATWCTHTLKTAKYAYLPAGCCYHPVHVYLTKQPSCRAQK
jgi:hypothetical protein